MCVRALKAGDSISECPAGMRVCNNEGFVIICQTFQCLYRVCWLRGKGRHLLWLPWLTCACTGRTCTAYTETWINGICRSGKQEKKKRSVCKYTFSLLTAKSELILLNSHDIKNGSGPPTRQVCRITREPQWPSWQSFTCAWVLKSRIWQALNHPCVVLSHLLRDEKKIFAENFLFVTTATLKHLCPMKRNGQAAPVRLQHLIALSPWRYLLYVWGNQMVPCHTSMHTD